MIKANNKGVISVEATISVGLLIVIVGALINLLTLVYLDEHIEQEVHEWLYDFEKLHFAYQRLGVEGAIHENMIPKALKNDYQDILDQAYDLSENHIFESIFKKKLEAIVNKPLKTYVFLLEDELVKVTYAYEVSVFNQVYTLSHSLEKKLWLYGDAANFYPETLSEKFKGPYVYITKSGGKYHGKTCFYIRRSTTDRKRVRKVTLVKAKNDLGLTVCLVCNGGIDEGK